MVVKTNNNYFLSDYSAAPQGKYSDLRIVSSINES